MPPDTTVPEETTTTIAVVADPAWTSEQVDVALYAGVGGIALVLCVLVAIFVRIGS